jgi:hypothetical protein
MLTALLALVALALPQDPPQIIPIPSETMPAESIPVSPFDYEAPIKRPPRDGPWVKPGEAGANSPFAVHQTNTWGWNIPKEQPTVGVDKALGASNNSVINTHYSGPGGPVSWSDSRFYGVPPNINSAIQTKWGWVVFDFWDGTFTRCTWDSIAVEHGLYVTGWGPQTFYNSSWSEVNGQAYQGVYSHPDSKRASQTGLDRRTWLRLGNSLSDEPIEFRRCWFDNVGRPAKSERASYIVSCFEVLNQNGPFWNPVLVTECWIETNDPWIDVNGIMRDSAGGIMAHARPHVEISRNMVMLRRPDRDPIQVWACSDGKPGTPDVVISENYILSAQAVDIRLRTPEDTVIIQRNGGRAEVVIHTNPWYVWESNGWDEGKVIYRGDITQNYRLN